MVADGIAFVCFYDDKRVLSAIAECLIHILEEREGRSRKRGEGKG